MKSTPSDSRTCASAKCPMRALAMTGIVTVLWMPSISAGSLIRATPPSRRMSAGTRSSAITATAPASSAIFAWAASTTSMITPPLSISASPRFTRNVPVVGVTESGASAMGLKCTSGSRQDRRTCAARRRLALGPVREQRGRGAAVLAARGVDVRRRQEEAVEVARATPLVLGVDRRHAAGVDADVDQWTGPHLAKHAAVGAGVGEHRVVQQPGDVDVARARRAHRTHGRVLRLEHRREAGGALLGLLDEHEVGSVDAF